MNTNADGSPVSLGGTIRNWKRYSQFDNRGVYALNVNQKAYDLISVENGASGTYFVSDLDNYPLASDEIYYVNNLSDSGNGSLRNGVDDSGVRLILSNVGGYISLNTLLSIPSNKVLDFGTAPSPVCLRKSSIGSGELIEIGGLNTVSERVVLRNVTLMAGRGQSTPQKHKNILVRNGFCFLDHVTSVLSNDEAIVATNNPIGEGLSSLTNPNIVAWDCVFGATLYESSGSSNPEGLHPMNFNIQEQTFAIVRNSLFFACEQRNPLVTEASGCLLVDCYIYAGIQLPRARNEVDLDPVLVELAGVLIRQGKRTTSDATFTNIATSMVFYPVNVYLDYTRLLRDGTVDAVNPETAGDEITILPSPTISPTMDKIDIHSYMLENAGARLPSTTNTLDLIVYQIENQLGDSRAPTTINNFYIQDSNPLGLTFDGLGYPVEP